MNLQCKNKVFLAPMEEVNDIVFRILCKKAGAGLTWTPLTNPLTKQKQHLEYKPILQIFCKETKGIKEFMKKYDKKVSGWDFNLGCPAATAKKHLYGSYLTDLKIIEKILKTMRKNTKKFLCVKIRKSPIAFDLLKLAEKYCDVIAIHPRTRAQGYSGEPDLKFALEFKKKSKIPVIYSGNVHKENTGDYLKKFDYVMIGRSAIGNPNVFSKTSKITFKDYFKLLDKYDLPFRQIKFQAMQFTKGKANSRKLRNQMFRLKTLDEIKNLIIKSLNRS